MKQLTTFLFLFISFAEGSAQQYYPIFTQNYSNPFIVNPSLLTLDRRPEVNVTFRQQWVGIQDGPKSIQFDFQYPFSPRISVGLNFYNDQTILLNNSGGLATFGYRVPLHSNHILGFGLSAGFISNQIDLEGVPDIDLVDPVLLNGSDNLAFDGQFGFHYQTGGFMLGASLLKLVDNRPFSEGAVEREKFDPFKDRAAILAYRFRISDGISVLPTLYYRSTYSGYEYFEGSLLVDCKSLLTIGSGYRLHMGPHVMIRLRLKTMQAGYSYDFPSTQYGGSTGGSHEVQVKFQFGNDVDPIQVLAKNDSAIVEEVPEERVELIVQNEKPAPVDRQESSQVERDVERVNVAPVPQTGNVIEEGKEVANTEVPDTEVRKSDIADDEYPRNVTYQLVVGAFARRSHADRYVRQLFSEGIIAKVLTSTNSVLYYVIVPRYTTKVISLDRVLELRNSTQFKDAWFKEFKQER